MGVCGGGGGAQPLPLSSACAPGRNTPCTRRRSCDLCAHPRRCAAPRAHGGQRNGATMRCAAAEYRRGAVRTSKRAIPHIEVEHQRCWPRKGSVDEGSAFITTASSHAALVALFPRNAPPPFARSSSAAAAARRASQQQQAQDCAAEAAAAARPRRAASAAAAAACLHHRTPPLPRQRPPPTVVSAARCKRGERRDRSRRHWIYRRRRGRIRAQLQGTPCRVPRVLARTDGCAASGLARGAWGGRGRPRGDAACAAALWVQLARSAEAAARLGGSRGAREQAAPMCALACRALGCRHEAAPAVTNVREALLQRCEQDTRHTQSSAHAWRGVDATAQLANHRRSAAAQSRGERREPHARTAPGAAIRRRECGSLLRSSDAPACSSRCYRAAAARLAQGAQRLRASPSAADCCVHAHTHTHSGSCRADAAALALRARMLAARAGGCALAEASAAQISARARAPHGSPRRRPTALRSPSCALRRWCGQPSARLQRCAAQPRARAQAMVRAQPPALRRLSCAPLRRW